MGQDLETVSYGRDFNRNIGRVSASEKVDRIV